MNKPKYRIYATLLDSFAWYQESESDSAEQELIDKINRVPETDPDAIERMRKGTALNNLIDELLTTEVNLPIADVINYDGFEFDGKVVDALCDALDGSVKQHFTSTAIIAGGQWVELYGYVDYIKMYKAIDLKTTKAYDLGKYRSSLQRHVYPVSLFNEGTVVDEFEFLVTDGKNVFKETYKVDLIESNSLLAIKCAEFIQFIESRRHLITDLKLFNQASPAR